jgi:hypothetical protein
MASLLFYLKYFKTATTRQLVRFGVLVFSLVLIKCVFNGYEFISTALIMMMVPFIFYSAVNRLSVRKFFTAALVAVASSGLAILFSFVILIFQIAAITGSLKTGINHIVISLEKRTYGNPADFSKSFQDSLSSNPTEVLSTYLQGVYFDKNFIPRQKPPENGFSVRYWHLVTIFGMVSAILFIFRKRFGPMQRKDLSLILTAWFSILAPLSWLIIFKAHSFIHTHMDFIVWQMPYTLFGFAICGLTLNLVLRGAFFGIRKQKHPIS